MGKELGVELGNYFKWSQLTPAQKANYDRSDNATKQNLLKIFVSRANDNANIARIRRALHDENNKRPANARLTEEQMMSMNATELNTWSRTKDYNTRQNILNAKFPTAAAGGNAANLKRQQDAASAMIDKMAWTSAQKAAMKAHIKTLSPTQLDTWSKEKNPAAQGNILNIWQQQSTGTREQTLAAEKKAAEKKAQITAANAADNLAFDQATGAAPPPAPAATPTIPGEPGSTPGATPAPGPVTLPGPSGPTLLKQDGVVLGVNPNALPQGTPLYLNQAQGLRNTANEWQGLEEKRIAGQEAAASNKGAQEAQAAQMAARSQMAQRGAGSRGAMASIAGQGANQARMSQMNVGNQANAARANASVQGQQMRQGAEQSILGGYGNMLSGDVNNSVNSWKTLAETLQAKWASAQDELERNKLAKAQG